MKDKEIKKITKKISRYDNVSFDIFDTLIKRNCEKPDDIFEISQKRYNNISNAKISNFRNLRINAEIEARNTSKDEEITLSDIYNNINEFTCINVIDLMSNRKYNINPVALARYPLYEST